MKKALLLFAHGARDPRWALPFEDIASRIRQEAPEVLVQLAYLELMTPSLVEAGEALVAQACTHIHVLPMFLGAGGHVRKDLPALLERLAAAHPTVHWRLSPPVGELQPVMAAMARAAIEALETTA